MRRERYEDAAIALEAMTRSYPELITPYLNLAIAFERSGHADKAEQTLRAALVQHPRSALAYNHLGLLYRQGGRFSQAREAYEQALKIDPDYTDAHFNLAILYDLYLQQPSSAFLHYEYYRHAGGNDPMVERWLADLRQRMSQPAAGAKP
jgi:tetratricopeptide (TPR) repeat protein